MSSSELTKIATSEHVAYCFDMLLEELTNVPSEYDWTKLPLGHAKMPVFVTWYKRPLKKKYDELRGCLGTFSQELPIGVGLKKYSIMSALNDKRFDPISVSEIGLLKCSISLLHSFTRAKTWDDWELGKHGITIHFTDSSVSGKTYNATYLPEVPGQQRWNKLITIENLVSKAGFNGNASQVKNLTVTKYQSCKSTMTWLQYLNYTKSNKIYHILNKRIKLLYQCTTPQIYNMIINNDKSFYVSSQSSSDQNEEEEEDDDDEEEQQQQEVQQYKSKKKSSNTKYKSSSSSNSINKPSHSYRNNHNYHHNS